MKSLLLILAISSFAFAADDKKPEPLTVVGSKALAKYDQSTGEWTLEKGAKPEEVYTALLRDIANLNQQLQQCQQAAETKKKK